MLKKCLWVISSLLFALSLTAYAGILFDDEIDVTGTYRCTGHDPYTPRDFESTINIQQTGEVLSITETTADKHYDSAIGLISGEILALAYQDKLNPRKIGIQTLAIQDGGRILTGPWAQLDKTKVGSETCTKIIVPASATPSTTK